MKQNMERYNTRTSKVLFYIAPSKVLGCDVVTS